MTKSSFKSDCLSLLEFQMTVTSWKYGEPNNTNNEDCGAIYQKDGNAWMGKWKDVDCDNNFLYFICEKSL